MDINKFREVSTLGYSRVQMLRSGELVNGKTSWLSRTWGILSRQRTKENQNIHDQFGKALMREYGYAGELALSQRWGGLSRTKLSSADIKEMIEVAEKLYSENQEAHGGENNNRNWASSKLKDSSVIKTVDQFNELASLPHLQEGDILIKKIFPGTGGTVEKAIVSGQGLFQKDEEIHSKGATELGRHKFPLMGSKTSEHAAIAVAKDRIAEADGNGVQAKDLGNVDKGTQYLIFRPRNADIAREIRSVASALAEGGDRKIKYSTWGAIASSFRSAVNNAQAEVEVQSGLRHATGVSGDKRSMFCSEFAAMCVEVASLKQHDKMALGVNPQAVSPMVLEHLLNQRPDLFTVAGKYVVGAAEVSDAQPPAAEKTEAAPAPVPDAIRSAAPLIAKDVQSDATIDALLGRLEDNRARLDRNANDDPVVLIRNELQARQAQFMQDPLVGLVSRLENDSGLEHELYAEFGTENNREALLAAIRNLPPKGANERIDAVHTRLVLKKLSEDESEKGLLSLGQQQSSADEPGANGAVAQAPAASFNIDAFIRAEGFTTHAIPPDGHCMFASLAHAAGGELRAAFESDPFEAGMIIRQRIMGQLVELEPERIARVAGSDMPSTRAAVLGAAFLELARGFNVTTPEQTGFGTAQSLPIAAAILDRPIVVIDQEGKANVYQPDCSAAPLNNQNPLNQGDLKAVIQELRKDDPRARDPIVIYKSGPAHFQSVGLNT